MGKVWNATLIMCDMELVENTHTAVPIRPALDDDDPGHREPAKPLTGDSTPQPHRSTRIKHLPDKLM